MPIDIKHVNTNTNNRVGNASAKASQHKGATAATNAPSQTVKSDSVSITSQAQQLQSAQAKLNDIPEIDIKKVEQIKAAIAEGRYKIDADKLATNIAQFEKELQDLN
ncbi:MULTISPECIES: flagellar biosynthesis anti-sigma factor FlgM [Shewanella]|uniref:flagellar biosynthesis anti-sigma factor FlgM n=1 Tax=Shewanella TaxID=22 RepID=UPI0005A08706|nr:MULTISPECIES: flagellar biosynthesis anti-sigma factor FlgM [Shewanella]KIO36063.1 flagellar biosynthesis anti-sigma factor FlgM [Shewanella sp. cp20]MCG9722776.1 flagellar biosynthesis anti-sigma factor FlgM [Shewanella sp. Isolate7]MCG9745835.1 flagellar biosynthesis anti-sigma factor FlgM [Shewanella sp. Isolate8]MCL2910800.1 flagellar biosynthesis anti-sigma factor FlgM [Shewanella aquimarina]